MSTKKAAKKPRKIRGDAQVGTVERKLGLPPGTIRNPSGRNTRDDKLVSTIRKAAKKGKK